MSESGSGLKDFRMNRTKGKIVFLNSANPKILSPDSDSIFQVIA